MHRGCNAVRDIPLSCFNIFFFIINKDMNYEIRKNKYLNMENIKFTNNDMFY